MTEVTKKPEPVVELRTQTQTQTQGNEISINDGEECCPCSTTTTATAAPKGQISNNRIPELEGELRYFGGGLDEPAISFATIDPEAETDNKLTRFPPKGKPSLSSTTVSN